MRAPAVTLGWLATGLLLASCSDEALIEPMRRPAARPDALVPVPPPKPIRTARSEISIALEDYYRRIEQQLLTQGLLRRDGGGADTPFDADRLAETFTRVALFEEYSARTGILEARETASRLHRWEAPVRIEARYGAALSEEKKARDSAAIGSLAGRLARVTDHPISQVASGGNFTVFIVNEDERRALGPQLRQLMPQLGDAALRSVLDLPKSNYCVVFALDPANSGRYTRAVSIIRSEHPDLLRLSCIHEEIAQGLGLANDTPTARPSVFNDDEEFALLTPHDELLLKMLYDPRLSPGMTEAQAAPIVAEIAAELMGGPS